MTRRKLINFPWKNTQTCQLLSSNRSIDDFFQVVVVILKQQQQQNFNE